MIQRIRARSREFGNIHILKVRNVKSVMGCELSRQLNDPGNGCCCSTSISNKYHVDRVAQSKCVSPVLEGDDLRRRRGTLCAKQGSCVVPRPKVRNLPEYTRAYYVDGVIRRDRPRRCRRLRRGGGDGEGDRCWCEVVSCRVSLRRIPGITYRETNMWH